MKLFQSERRLSRELTRILAAAQEEKMLFAEKKAQEDEEDFLVYLPSDLQVNEVSFHHYQIRDGAEIVLQL
jgi:hypothetical protein